MNARIMANELRRFASLANQWADVLDREDEPSDPSPEAARESGERGEGKGDPVPPVAAAAADRPPPVFFRCPMCGQRKEWKVQGRKPWPSAVCSTCYAELEERRDQAHNEIEGYTGVR